MRIRKRVDSNPVSRIRQAARPAAERRDLEALTSQVQYLRMEQADVRQNP